MAKDELNPIYHLAVLHVLDIWGRYGKAEQIILSTILGIDSARLDDFPVVYFPSPDKDRMPKSVRIVPLKGCQNCFIGLPEYSSFRTTDIVYPAHVPTSFPILNFNPSTIADYLSNEPMLNQPKLLEVYCEYSAFMKNTPFITLCLNFPDSEPFADFGVPYWWRRRDKGIAKDVHVIEFDLDDSGEFETKFFDALSIPTERRMRIDEADQNFIHIPQLGSARVKLGHLGVGVHAYDGFVRDCLKALVNNRIEGRVWVDSVKIERLENLSNHNTDMMIYDTYRNHDIWLYMNGIAVAIPLYAKISAYRNLNSDRFQQVSGVGRVSAAYVVYLEVDGTVYDSYRASMQPVPLEEYQSQLKSTFRGHFDVVAGMSLLKAWTGMYDLIRQARYDLEMALLGEYRIPTLEYGTSYTVLPSLCFAEVRLKNVGPAYILPHDTRSEAFVRDCLEALIDCRQTFRIWVDSVLQTPRDRHFEAKHINTAHHESTRDEIVIPQGAYHCYIEYNGMAFDNYHAFAEPIPIAEYQQNLKSTWRGSLEVAPDMTLEAVETAFNDLIQQAINR